MEMTKEEFKKELQQRLKEKYAMEIADASPQELYNVLGSVVKAYYSDAWRIRGDLSGRCMLIILPLIYQGKC